MSIPLQQQHNVHTECTSHNLNNADNLSAATDSHQSASLVIQNLQRTTSTNIQENVFCSKERDETTNVTDPSFLPSLDECSITSPTIQDSNTSSKAWFIKNRSTPNKSCFLHER